MPARELLAEILLQMKQPAKALPEFEAVLRNAPNRYNALAGAARAAQLAGDTDKAKSFSAQLLANCNQANGDRPSLKDAKLLLAAK